tara:strand:+ start:958 stop:1212 length:255 start_codon:yes stop_codon:yes gene_type:complete
MNTQNAKIAQELFKNAIQLMRQEAFTDPTVSDTRVIANLAAKHIKWDCYDSYHVIEMLLQECNDKEVADEFNKIPQVFNTQWES